ncbi:MAG TPA: sensor histidine kinase [Mycobacteriales bacterium]|nr:sensor histidine kinase [Mycobacteriales bacterium]
MKGEASRAPATLAWVAVVVAILDALAMGVAFAVGAAMQLKLGIVKHGDWINIAAGSTFPLVAALILRTRGGDRDRPPRIDRLAWALLGVGVLSAATVAGHVWSEWMLSRHLLGAVGFAWVSDWLWTGVVPGILLVLLWFPTGDVPGRRWRWVVPGAACACLGIWLSVAFDPGRMADYQTHVDNPLGWSSGGAVLDVASKIGFATLGLVAIATIASVVVRFFRADAAVRAQMRWLLIAVLVFTLTFLLPNHGWFGVTSLVVNIAATFLLPVTLAVAITRRDGYGLPRVLVFGFLSTLLLSAYIAVVGGAQAVFDGRADRVATLAAAAGVAFAAAPLRARLQHGVDRLLYGDRGDPYAALSDLGRRIAGSPDDLLHEVVGAVADALRAPYAAVTLTGDATPAASVGRVRSHEVIVPLTLRGEDVGALVVAQRTPTERYGARDLALLHDLARHIAVAAHAAALTRDLQRSRESLVLAREEERRRIRRDLHDGLGPALAGVAFGLDAARNTMDRDPTATAEALMQLKSEVQSSIADVRRLVYDLRPPTLDQLGLVPALEEYAARLSERGGIMASVSARPLPALPAAVEVAAYRIATEALTNAARHSGGRSASVVVDADDGGLRLDVIDDGVGAPTQADVRHRGIGLSAMAERAAELGGRCEVTQGAGGGTAVRAVLPMRMAAVSDDLGVSS